MTRGQRKSIEDKITDKEELVKAINSRIEKETKELKALLSQ